MNFLEFLKSNLSHALPILVCAAFAIAIISERLKALYKTYPLPETDAFYAKVAELVMAAKVQDAITLCEKYPDKPVARVMKSALKRAHLPENLIEDGVRLAVSEAVQSILKRTSFLATIANVATLLGLFGTIAGLISSFEAVGHADAQQKSALLSAGIATAMNATMLGLAVAIPCMVAFSFLINRSNRMISEIEDSSVRAGDILKQRLYTPSDASHESGAA